MKAIFARQGKPVIYLKKQGKIDEMPIDLLAENDQFCIVSNTVNEGDVVLLYQPEEFKVKMAEVASR